MAALEDRTHTVRPAMLVRYPRKLDFGPSSRLMTELTGPPLRLVPSGDLPGWNRQADTESNLLPGLTKVQRWPVGNNPATTRSCVRALPADQAPYQRSPDLRRTSTSSSLNASMSPIGAEGNFARAASNAARLTASSLNWRRAPAAAVPSARSTSTGSPPSATTAQLPAAHPRARSTLAQVTSWTVSPSSTRCQVSLEIPTACAALRRDEYSCTRCALTWSPRRPRSRVVMSTVSQGRPVLA